MYTDKYDQKVVVSIINPYKRLYDSLMVDPYIQQLFKIQIHINNFDQYVKLICNKLIEEVIYCVDRDLNLYWYNIKNINYTHIFINDFNYDMSIMDVTNLKNTMYYVALDIYYILYEYKLLEGFSEIIPLSVGPNSLLLGVIPNDIPD